MLKLFYIPLVLGFCLFVVFFYRFPQTKMNQNSPLDTVSTAQICVSLLFFSFVSFFLNTGNCES